MIPKIINKTTNQYLRDDFNHDPMREKSISLSIPPGFRIDKANPLTYDATLNQWTGTLLPEYELIAGVPQLSAITKRTNLELKAENLLNTEFAKRVQIVKNGYQQEEIDSWAKQEKEARDYITDPVNALTPLISEIAVSRGIDIATFANLVITKADLYASIIGPIIGKRKLLVDALPSKTDMELENYDVVMEWGP